MSYHTPSCAFASHAREYFDAGLAVLPLGGDDGKRPIVQGFHKRAIGPDEISRLSSKFPDANLGILPAMSTSGNGACLVIVDVDSADPIVHAEVARLYGDTPIIVSTPTMGHTQRWYRSPRRISSRDLRSAGSGLPVEIKCDGTLCVLPPSNHPDKGPYRFSRGSLADLHTLPYIDMSSMTVPDRRTTEGKSIDVGLRNKTLHSFCLREVKCVDDLDALVDCAQTYADTCFIEPMSPAEIAKTARSAWGMEQRGCNWVGNEASFVTTRAAFTDLLTS